MIRRQSETTEGPTLLPKRIRQNDYCKQGGIDHQVKQIVQEKIAVKKETSIGKYDSWNELYIKIKKLGCT